MSDDNSNPTLRPTTPTSALRADHRPGHRSVAWASFRIHATVYVLVNVLVAAIDLADGGDFGTHRMALGWGIGLLVHALVVLSPFGLFDWCWLTGCGPVCGHPDHVGYRAPIGAPRSRPWVIEPDTDLVDTDPGPEVVR